MIEQGNWKGWSNSGNPGSETFHKKNGTKRVEGENHVHS
jgi:hypothetical protein